MRDQEAYDEWRRKKWEGEMGNAGTPLPAPSRADEAEEGPHRMVHYWDDPPASYGIEPIPSAEAPWKMAPNPYPGSKPLVGPPRRAMMPESIDAERRREDAKRQNGFASEARGGGQGSPDEQDARSQAGGGAEMDPGPGMDPGGIPQLRNPVTGSTDPAAAGKVPLPEDDPRYGLYSYLLQEKNRRKNRTRALPGYDDLEQRGNDNADHKALSGLAVGLMDSASMAGTLGGKRADLGQLPKAAEMIDEGRSDRLKSLYQVLKQRNEDAAQEGDVYKTLAIPEMARMSAEEKRAALQAQLQNKLELQRMKPNGGGKPSIWKLDEKLTDADGNPLYVDQYGNRRPLPPGFKPKDKPKKDGPIQFVPDVLTADGNPVRVGEHGKAEEYPLPPGAKPKPKGGAEKDTSDQFKVGGFAKRLEQAEQVFDSLGKKGYDRTATAGAAYNAIAPGAFQGGDYKTNEQAERNFINATLRRESGASISPSEFESAEKQYFPRPGDPPELLAQKKANREQIRQNFMAEAKGAYEKIPSIEGTGAGGAPSGSKPLHGKDLP